MPDADAFTDPAGSRGDNVLLALAAARADAAGRRLREEVRLGVNDELLRMADEADAEAGWRPSEAHFARRAGDAAAAALLDAEAQALRNVAAYLRAKIGLLP